MGFVTVFILEGLGKGVFGLVWVGASFGSFFVFSFESLGNRGLERLYFKDFVS